MTPLFYRIGWPLALLLVALCSCHDAPRDNPFDPALTPPVELQVALDDTAGTATLTWTPYEGQQPFEEYRVLRNIVERTRVDTLAHLPAVEQTSYVDTTLAPGTTYEYRVMVVNGGGFAVSSAGQVALPLTLPPVRIARADFDSRTAAASLEWTRYQGPRFKAYRVERRTAGLTPTVLEEIPDLADTSFADQGLMGNTEYFYRVVVVTERGEEAPSAEQSGAFHRLLATWPLGKNRSFVRLYMEGQQIVALVNPAGRNIPDFVRRVLFFDLEGQLLDTQVLGVGTDPVGLTQRATATAASEGGQRFISISGKGSFDLTSQGTTGLLSLSPDQQPAMREYRLFENAFPEPLGGPEARVLGEIALKGFNGRFHHVEVSAGGNLLFAEDFAAFPSGVLRGTIQGWDFSGAETSTYNNGVLYMADGVAHRTDATWQDFRLETDGALPLGYESNRMSIQLGGDTFSSFALTLDMDSQQIALDWTFSPPAELGLEAKNQRFTMPFPVLPDQPYRLGLEMVDGQLSASVRAPLVWVGANTSEFHWTSMAALGEQLAFTVYDQPYLLTPEREVIPHSPFEAGVGEMRAWEGRRGSQLGVCLPALNKLLIGSIPAGQEADWPTYLVNTLGPALGPPAEFLFYPLSFDVGPDGRIYVLDAGNARIVVFDSSRRYLTQWGKWGKGEGEFNFGRGARSYSGELDFAGSIAVDDQGYIYVCDEINGRIQKFAP